MGACTSGESNEDLVLQKKSNKKIDVMLSKERKKIREEVKLLLLGSGESGKSTIYKQMKIISLYGGFTEEEINMWKSNVYFNIISEMKILVDNTLRLAIDFESEEAKAAADLIENSSSDGDSWTDDIAKAVAILWKDGGIQKTFASRDKEFQLNESAAYFFSELSRFIKKDYAPTHQDILRARVRSIGIEEATFNLDGLEFKLIDVGGQRSERRKWIHCFDGVTAVLFCASLSEYDQVLREDKNQNRMKESLLLFDEISNSPWFDKTAMILFLNKTDLLKSKITVTDAPLKKIFSNYTGGCNYDKAAAFIQDRYEELPKTKKGKLYTHFTCAIDTEGVLFVFKSVRNALMKDIISDIGVGGV